MPHNQYYASIQFLGLILVRFARVAIWADVAVKVLNGPAELWLLLCLSLFVHLRRQFLIICCLHLYRTHLVDDLWLTDLWLISYRTFLQAFLRLSASASQHHFIAQSGDDLSKASVFPCRDYLTVDSSVDEPLKICLPSHCNSCCLILFFVFAHLPAYLDNKLVKLSYISYSAWFSFSAARDSYCRQPASSQVVTF